MIKRLTGPKRQYYDDPFGPSLSASTGDTLIRYSPLHAWYWHPLLGKNVKPTTEPMDLGSIVGALLLGTGAEYQVIDAKDYRTKAAQEARDVVRAAGKIPILPAKLEEAQEIHEQIVLQLNDLEIELSGESEYQIAWEDQTEDGQVVQCKSALDHFIQASGTIIDIKTTYCAQSEAIQRSIMGNTAIMQIEAYQRAVACLHPDLAGRTQFMFIFVEMDPPYCVVPVVPSGTMRELSRRKWQQAVNTWHRCLTTDHWPGYTEGIVTVDAPNWAIFKMYDEGEAIHTEYDLSELNLQKGETHGDKEDVPR